MNQPDPVLGVILHAIGGLASASFYLVFRGVKGWSWESSWLVGGVFSWIIAPWAFALVQVPDLLRVLAEAPIGALLWAYFFGVLWGIGGLTFGLTMRVSRDRPGHGHGARLLRRVRHAHAAALPRRAGRHCAARAGG